MSDTTQTMLGMYPPAQAQKAIRHMLRRISDSPEVGWYCGTGTEAFALLTEAYATLSGVELSEVRRAFECQNARNPAAPPKEAGCSDSPLEDLITESDALGWLEGSTPGERLEFFRSMHRYCLRCGCDNVGACGCNCRIGRGGA